MARTTTLKVKLRDPKGKIVDAIVMIGDGKAVSKFSDPTLAKKLYKVEKRAGKNVEYNKTMDAFIEYFRGMKMEQITMKIGREIKKAGGKFTGREEMK